MVFRKRAHLVSGMSLLRGWGPGPVVLPFSCSGEGEASGAGWPRAVTEAQQRSSRAVQLNRLRATGPGCGGLGTAFSLPHGLPAFSSACPQGATWGPCQGEVKWQQRACPEGGPCGKWTPTAPCPSGHAGGLHCHPQSGGIPQPHVPTVNLTAGQLSSASGRKSLQP